MLIHTCRVCAVLLAAVLMLGCGGGGRSAKQPPTGVNANDLSQTLAELDALQVPTGVDPALFASLKDSLRGALLNRGKIVLTPPSLAVNDLIEVTPLTDPPTINWSSKFFVGDGSQDGSIGIEDLTLIAIYYNQNPSSNPWAMVADYNRDDIVNVADITQFAQALGRRLDGFLIEYADSTTGPWATAGDVNRYDALPNKNANGFSQWNYQFPAGTLNSGDNYVRVVPYDLDHNEGEPCTPIFISYIMDGFDEFTVTGIRINITGTTNTDYRDENSGTQLYVAPEGGGDTFGEAPANSAVFIDLDRVSYVWNSIPYDYDDPLPGDLTQFEYDNYLFNLKDFMTYTVESVATPFDPEAWSSSDIEHWDGLEGYLGPNDDVNPPNLDAAQVTAHMADNDLTQGASTFDVTVRIDLLADPAVPLIYDFTPLQQMQNETLLHTVRFTFGGAETGAELPAEVMLCDRNTKVPAYYFTPAAVVETSGPPTIPGEYTIQRFTGDPNYTTALTLMVDGLALQPGVGYAWRITRQDGSVVYKSSLMKPADVLTILEP
jgi:hypothetical protein